ncbi:sensor histidine kinase [Abyssisolibacter fermentans]|uniref:sensor histidine kinase n=1 Tax=Abyssisolibacter fermentans TaxID=1766203 RepID=UPI000836E9DF|nr:ATP-binding protein [Abyssisolibacter fermentans]
MKKKSILKKYIIWFMLITICFMSLVGIITYKGIKDFFTEETYKTIEHAQSIKLPTVINRINRDEVYKEEDIAIDQNSRAVGHMYATYNKETEKISSLKNLQNIPFDFEDIKKNISKQIKNGYEEKRYVQNIEGKKLYYVIKKIDNRNINRKILSYKQDNKNINRLVKQVANNSFIISYMWETYSNELTKNIFGKFIIVIFSFMIIIFILSYAMIKKISIRFNKLQTDVANIASMQWDKPIYAQDDDEIGRLSQSIDKMRLQLKKYDEDLRNYFHSISHELKTPIMIIKGYTDSILSKKYPKGDLDSSLMVIDEEIDRLEDMVRNILYLNKIDFISKNYSVNSTLNIVSLIENASKRFKRLDETINWDLNITYDYEVRGLEEQWESVLNNILDNQVRYAKNNISIYVKNNIITISNDGPSLDDKTIEKLFTPFFKGKRGSTGLGLFIVKKLLNLNKYDIIANNTSDGVSFSIIDIS